MSANSDDAAHDDGHLAQVAWPSVRRSLFVAAVVSGGVTLASRLLPGEFANLGVAAIFLGSTAALALRDETAKVRAYGLSLGGLFEPETIEPKRVVRDALRAVGWAVLLGALLFPPFIIAYGKLWAPQRAFVWRLPPDWFDRVAGQVLVIALPEEAFFRGFLQSALDGRLRARYRLFDAELGPGLLVSAAIFAVGHVLTVPQPGRLAVFFPALVFGWLRARTGGIGAGLAFHAACNLLSTMLALGFGLRAP